MDSVRPDSVKYLRQFRRDEREARENRRGLWKSNKKLLAELQEEIKQAAIEYKNNYLAQSPATGNDSQGRRT